MLRRTLLGVVLATATLCVVGCGGSAATEPPTTANQEEAKELATQMPMPGAEMKTEQGTNP